MAMNLSRGTATLAGCLILIARASGGEAPPLLKPSEETLPRGAVARLGSAHFWHRGQVQGLVFTPDGKSVASASDDGVFVWDVISGKRPLFLPQLQDVDTRALSR